MAKNVLWYLCPLPLRGSGIHETCHGELDRCKCRDFISAYFQKQLSTQIYGIQMFRDLKVQVRYLLGLEKYEKWSSIPVKTFVFLPRWGLKSQYIHKFL